MIIGRSTQSMVSSGFPESQTGSCVGILSRHLVVVGLGSLVILPHEGLSSHHDG